MQSLPPLTRTDLDIDDGNLVRRVFASLWQELPLLVLGALLPAAACAPAALLLLFGQPGLAGLAALLCMAPAWAAYCRLAACIAVQRRAGLRALPQALAAVYRRSIVLAAPLLLLSYWWAVTDAFLQTTLPPDSAVLLIAAEVATTAVLLVTGCMVALALGLVGAFDLGVRAAGGNSLLILLARPGTVLGLAGLAYLLATAAGVLGPGGWLPALALFASFQTHATLLASKQLLDVRHRVREPVRYPSAAVPSNREEEGK